MPYACTALIIGSKTVTFRMNLKKNAARSYPAEEEAHLQEANCREHHSVAQKGGLALHRHPRRRL